MNNQETGLVDRMRALALVRDDLPENWNELADKLEAAIQISFSDTSTQSMQRLLGCWTRARRAWCNATGESLI